MTSQKNNEINEHFEKIYEETNRSVTLFLISKCKNFADVNDILQEVYMEYYKVLMRKGLDYIKEDEKFLISLCRKKIATYYSFWDRIPHKLYLDEKEDYEKEELLSDAYDADMDDVDDEFLRKKMIEDVKVLLKKQSDGSSASEMKKVNAILGNTGVVVSECEVSPISLRAVIDTSNMKTEKSSDGPEYPKLSGVKLKDGTLLTCITGGGSEFSNKDGKWEVILTTSRIIDVDEVESFLFVKSSWEEGETCSEDNFYEVSIED